MPVSTANSARIVLAPQAGTISRQAAAGTGGVVAREQSARQRGQRAARVETRLALHEDDRARHREAVIDRRRRQAGDPGGALGAGDDAMRDQHRRGAQSGRVGKRLTGLAQPAQAPRRPAEPRFAAEPPYSKTTTTTANTQPAERAVAGVVAGSASSSVRGGEKRHREAADNAYLLPANGR